MRRNLRQFLSLARKSEAVKSAASSKRRGDGQSSTKHFGVLAYSGRWLGTYERRHASGMCVCVRLCPSRE